MLRDTTLSLRPLERSHLEKTRSWMNDPELMRLLNRCGTVTEAEHERWFADVCSRSDCAFFAIEVSDSGVHIGNVWLWSIDARHRKAELRIVIGDAGWRSRGAGVEAIGLLCAYAFDRLNLHKVYAYVLGINPRALRAFEKAGFEVEGSLRDDRWVGDEYTDVYLLGKLSTSVSHRS